LSKYYVVLVLKAIHKNKKAHNVMPQFQLSAEFEQLYVNINFEDTSVVLGRNTFDCNQSF